MDKVRVALIGIGTRSQSHFRCLAEMNDVEIASICDLNKDRLDKMEEKFGLYNGYMDYKQMLRDIQLDTVYIIMKPQLLDPIITYCLKQRKNVYIEKPPGTDVEEPRKWAKLAKENECKTMVSFQRRFHPCVVEAKRIVEERGRILHCVASFHKWNEVQHAYAKGDHLTHDVIHIVDLLRWMGGSVKRVHSICGQLYSNRPNHVNLHTALFEFKSGGTGVLNSNYRSGGRELFFEIHSKNISAYCSIPGMKGQDYYSIRKDNKPMITVKNEEIIGLDAPKTHIDGTFQANRHFIDCIKNDLQPLTNLQDASNTMKLIKEIKSGQRLPAVFSENDLIVRKPAHNLVPREIE